MIKLFEEWINEDDTVLLNESQITPLVKKGQTIKVVLEYLQGQPEASVEAHGDSFFNERSNSECFSFLFGGDMMMIAKHINGKWVSN